MVAEPGSEMPVACSPPPLLLTFRVSNLDGDARAADLEEHLTRHGAKPVRLRIDRDPETGRSRGVAHVDLAGYPDRLLQEGRVFMNRLLNITQTTTAAAPDESRMDGTLPSLEALLATSDGEQFPVLEFQMGAFIGEQCFFASETFPSPHGLATTTILQLDPQARKISWVLRQTQNDAASNNATSFVFDCNFSEIRDKMTFELAEEAGNGSGADSLNTYGFLTFTLCQPPKIYQGVFDMVEEFGVWEWSRQYKMVRQRIVTVPEFPDADFGGNLTYRFRVHLPRQTARERTLASKKIALLVNCNLIERNTKHRPCIQTVTSIPWQFVDVLRDVNDGNALAFWLRYLLQALVSKGVLNKYLLKKELVQEVQATDVRTAEMALELLHQESRLLLDPVDSYRTAREKTQHLSKKRLQLPDHCMLVRKVYVTPTRIVFVPPSIELGNRVLRQFHDHLDYFLRVGFADENLGKHLDGSKISEQVSTRIFAVLRDGLCMVERSYRFLAFSSSQLRDHACWFFGESEQHRLTCQQIRSWMGSFDHIRSVAKYAARLGQCFSSTTPFPLNDSCSIELIPDVERNGFCFSDGIGCVSPFLASKIAVAIGRDPVPSAFQVFPSPLEREGFFPLPSSLDDVQIRLGGYKGVLSVDPSMGAEQDIVRVRPSMKKFESDVETLGIVRASGFAPAYLNHQIITLLSSMHIDDDVFVNLQRKMRATLDQMFQDPQIALKLINQHTSEAEAFAALSKMLRAGIPLSSEPFLANTIQLFQCCKMKEAKQKARVFVEEGAQLMGILDETGTLQYGQIFVQFTDPRNSSQTQRQILTGTVLMAKMPAVHPGDVRVLECVDDPRLHHYVDVVVFPQNGERPHTYEASGSDLDGDVYFITWNQDLIPAIRNFRPLEYEAPPPVIVEEGVTMEDIKAFFVDYIRNDNLGLIATAHKIHADLHKNGVLSEKCIQLAKLHSLAVDFPKTGVPAHYDPQKYRVQQYPDFLHRFGTNSYRSEKALGKMYRDSGCESFRPRYQHLRANPVFLLDNMEGYLQEAFLIKQNFDYDVSRLMHQYGIRSEFELFTQLVMEFSRQNSRREFEMKQRLSIIVKKLSEQYRLLFWEGKGSSKRHFNSTSILKASAWYFVTYEAGKRKHGDTRRPLLGFAWMTVVDVLVEIYRRKRIGSLPSFTGDVDLLWNIATEVPVERPKRNRPIANIEQIRKDIATLKKNTARDANGIPIYPCYKVFAAQVQKTAENEPKEETEVPTVNKESTVVDTTTAEEVTETIAQNGIAGFTLLDI